LTANIYNNMYTVYNCWPISPFIFRSKKYYLSNFSFPCIIFCYVKIYDPREINAPPYCFIVSTILFKYPFHFSVTFIVALLFSKYLYHTLFSTFLLLKQR
jgi:hypothetical protein